MNIVRRNASPVSAYRPRSIDDQVGRLVENMFEDLISAMMPYSGLASLDQDGTVTPRLNIVETDKTYEVEAEIPGIRKDDVKISVENRRVMIEAQEKREIGSSDAGTVQGAGAAQGSAQVPQQTSGSMPESYRERSLRRYQASFTLPVEVDDAGAQAKLDNGILMLTLPKKQPSQGKQLTIQ
jgi:HSP20 family protein